MTCTPAKTQHWVNNRESERLGDSKFTSQSPYIQQSDPMLSASVSSFIKGPVIAQLPRLLCPPKEGTLRGSLRHLRVLLTRDLSQGNLDLREDAQSAAQLEIFSIGKARQVGTEGQ